MYMKDPFIVNEPAIGAYCILIKCMANALDIVVEAGL